LSAVRNAHRIVVMERGHIAEQGQHEQLLQQGGIYAKLWAMQGGPGPSAQRTQPTATSALAVPRKLMPPPLAGGST
jgi:ABC-type microcin C transport system duplicated ATPase subunit YejF